VFTGIIEELGTIKSKSHRRLTIKAPKIARELKIGDSVSVNGVCVTVVDLGPEFFAADVMEETLKISNLGILKVGDRCNLEKPLPLGGPLSGHLVTGHVDDVGIIKRKRTKGNTLEMEIGAPPALKKYIVSKGSIAVDGISLTVGEIRNGSFFVNIIPHTVKVTTLGGKNVGNRVNLEADILGKYVENFV
jgi:riboflavin synthase